jgi:raffinose/stachyose/melibiose transport system permease protein
MQNSSTYRKNLKAVLLLLLPAFLLYAAFEVLPILQSIYFSFFKWDGIFTVPLKFVGFNNFIYLWKDPYFPLALTNTLWFMILSTIVQLSVALLLALLISSKIKFIRIFKVAFFTPLVLSMTGVSIMWYFILYPETGVLSSIMSHIGLMNFTKDWLVDKGTALNSIILVNSWINIGFYMVIFLSAISSIDQDVIEYTEIDGCFGLRRVFSIIVPMIWDVMKVAIVMEITGNLKVFEIVFLMTKGGPDGLTNTLGTLLYNEAFVNSNFGTGSAISTIIFSLSLVFSVIGLKLMQRDSIY